jgi:hypothetical protein
MSADPVMARSLYSRPVVDPSNDFISEGGKIWPRIKAVAEGQRLRCQLLHASEPRVSSVPRDKKPYLALREGHFERTALI